MNYSKIWKKKNFHNITPHFHWWSIPVECSENILWKVVGLVCIVIENILYIQYKRKFSKPEWTGRNFKCMKK